MSTEIIHCDHCGSECLDKSLTNSKYNFCCTGCKTVFEILSENNLSDFYDIDSGKGAFKPTSFDSDKYSFLDNKNIAEKLKTYTIKGKSKVSFILPQIHCSACIWLLENLPDLKSGILSSKVDFQAKEVDIIFDESTISLKTIVELLATLGYQPKLDYDNTTSKKKANPNKQLYIKLGIAGFCFGNLMMLAFPDYLADGKIDEGILKLIEVLNLLFIIPLLYAGSDYFKSAYYGLKTKNFNIDVPISIGIVVLAVRSVIDISTGSGNGFVDSLGGLLFFLLIGKTFQQKTYGLLTFDRDYKSYFPLSVIRVKDGKDEYISLNEIEIGDELLIRNNEIVPTDSIVISENANVDYSFVTGESTPIEVEKNTKIYAGGKALGKSMKIIASEKFNQSYLTKLWNDEAFAKFGRKGISTLSNAVAKYFSIVVLLISIVGLSVWYSKDPQLAFDVFTSILIIACPCALALTLPFTYGSTLRVFGRNNFFLKSDIIVEYLSKINTIVFDKTGTLTKSESENIAFIGENIDEYKSLIYTGVTNSTHPISNIIRKWLLNTYTELHALESIGYEELSGKGIVIDDGNNKIRIGSAKWIEEKASNNQESSALIEINGRIFGRFEHKSEFRENIFETLQELNSSGYNISILSGDNKKDEAMIKHKLGEIADAHFNKLPEEKLEFIDRLQSEKTQVAMVGDGLNDSGGLAKANVGIAIAEETSNFTPGSDAILLAKNINTLPQFFKMSKNAIKISYMSIIISFLYNVIGISFALAGLLSPLVAAILMPVSSISVITFTVLSVNIVAKKLRL